MGLGTEEAPAAPGAEFLTTTTTTVVVVGGGETGSTDHTTPTRPVATAEELAEARKTLAEMALRFRSVERGEDGRPRMVALFTQTLWREELELAEPCWREVIDRLGPLLLWLIDHDRPAEATTAAPRQAPLPLEPPFDEPDFRRRARQLAEGGPRHPKSGARFRALADDTYARLHEDNPVTKGYVDTLWDSVLGGEIAADDLADVVVRCLGIDKTSRAYRFTTLAKQLVSGVGQDKKTGKGRRKGGGKGA